MEPRHSPPIQLENVTFGYNATATLQDVNVLADGGEATVILGPSGVGKSTFLRLIVGLERPRAGRVLVGDQDLATLKRQELHALRRRMGFCFQSGALLNSMTVGQNVAFPLVREGARPRTEMAARVEAALATVGLAGKGDVMPSELSGGMRKRAGLARALVLDPAILLFDEPTTGLDPILAGSIRDLVLRLKDAHRTMVIVTHDLDIAFAVADHMVIFEAGRVRVSGAPEEIRTSDDPFVRQFLEGRSDP